jgi:hypothetical protein
MQQILWHAPTLGTCDSRAGTALQEYVQYYHGWCHPDTNVLRWLEKRLWETGCLTPPACVNADRPCSVWITATEDTIIVDVEWEPLRSSHAITRELGLHQAFILNVLDDDNYIRISIRRTNINSQKIVLCGYSFANGCLSNMLLICSMKTFFGQIVFTSGHGLIFMLPVNVDIKSNLA